MYQRNLLPEVAGQFPRSTSPLAISLSRIDRLRAHD